MNEGDWRNTQQGSWQGDMGNQDWQNDSVNYQNQQYQGNQDWQNNVDYQNPGYQANSGWQNEEIIFEDDLQDGYYDNQSNAYEYQNPNLQDMDQQYQGNQGYRNPDLHYGNGELEYVMSMRDVLIYSLFFCIPIYNIIFLIKILSGPTDRTNKTITNSFRFVFIAVGIVFSFEIVIGILGMALLGSALGGV